MDASALSSDRRAANRRTGERRAPYRRLDSLFAATLVNQIATPEKPIPVGAYVEPRPTRAGLVVNVRV